MTQGGHRNDVLDLDDGLNPIPLKPKTVRVFGREWTIRRDWTAADVVQYWVLATEHKDVDAAVMLVGEKDGPEFAKISLSLPPEMVALKLRKICKIAGLLPRDAEDEESEGESSAS